jgi:hypothetical protein
MAVPSVNTQRIIQAVLHFGERLTRFKQGLADRAPDFSEFRRAVADFFARTFGREKQELNGNVRLPEQQPRPPEPAPVRQQRDLDPDLGELEKPFLRRRPSISDAAARSDAPPERTVDPAPISETLVQAINHAAADVGDVVEDAAAKIVKDTGALLESASEAIQETAIEIAKNAGGAIDRAANWLAGSPLSEAGKQLPEAMHGTHRKQNDSHIAKNAELPRSSVKHTSERKVLDEQFKPAFTKFFDRIRRSEPATSIEPKSRQQAEAGNNRPFTEDELKQATCQYWENELRIEADILNEQEAKFRNQSPSVKPSPRAIKTFDSTTAKKFQHWGDPVSPAPTTKAPVDTSLKPPIDDLGQPIDASALEEEVRALVRSLIPPRSILKRPDPSGIPRAAKLVRFSDQTDEQTIENWSDVKRATIANIDERSKLREVQQDMKDWHATGDRFIPLMLIALDNTQRRRKVNPHKMAIELYRVFTEEASADEWAAHAELSIRTQLQRRSRKEALSVLEPIIENFDGYLHSDHEDEDPGSRIVHDRLRDIANILHKLRDEQFSRAEEEIDLTPPDSPTSSSPS